MARIPSKSVNKNDKENLKILREISKILFSVKTKQLKSYPPQLNLQEQDFARTASLLDLVYFQDQLERKQKSLDN